MSDILLPDLGEGVESGTVTAIVVQPGDSVAEGDAIIEIETDKAVLPVPAPSAGVVKEIVVSEGQKIDVGSVIGKLEGGDAPAAAPAAEPEAPSEAAPVEAAPAAAPAAASPAPAAGGTSTIDVNLPDLGEGVAGGTVTALVVKSGDSVSEGEAIIEIETDKAVLPVPAPVDGVIGEILVSEGEKIEVGQKIASMEGSSSGAAPAAPAAPAPAEPSAPAPAAAEPVPAAAPAPTPAPAPASDGHVAAGPATRKLARELGIDLSSVKGTRRGGRISVEDLKAHVKNLNLGSAQPTEGSASAAPAAKPDWPSVPDFSKFGSVRREKMSNLRNIVSERMSMCWNRIPHVFQFNEVDLTELADVQKRYKADFKERGSSVSPTNFIIKAMAICLKEFPQFNSSLDEDSGEIVFKDYVNIGVAVDTPTGLIVPVLKGVDQMTIFEIGKELKELAAKTRDRKVTQDDLQGGCMTLSNLGGIGGTHFTPIVNWPEVAILGVGRSEVKPKYIDGEVVPRTMAQMTLSYDHRVIDGADGARFMVRFTEILENIERTLLGG